jgi:hypothetical protein
VSANIAMLILRGVDDRQPTSLERILARHVIELLLILEDLPEDQIDADTAVQLLEDVGAMTDQLSPLDQGIFLSIARDLADEVEATSGPRRADRMRKAIAALAISSDER